MPSPPHLLSRVATAPRHHPRCACVSSGTRPSCIQTHASIESRVRESRSQASAHAHVFNHARNQRVARARRIKTARCAEQSIQDAPGRVGRSRGRECFPRGESHRRESPEPVGMSLLGFSSPSLLGMQETRCACSHVRIGLTRVRLDGRWEGILDVDMERNVMWLSR